MSLFHPPAWFPPQLTFFWPIIWVQVLMLRAQIRATYGRGVKYHWCIGANGRVYLHSIDWIPGQKTDRAGLKPREHFNERLAAACDGRALMPAYAVQFGEHHDAGMSPAIRRFVLPRVLNLPLPET